MCHSTLRLLKYLSWWVTKLKISIYVDLVTILTIVRQTSSLCKSFDFAACSRDLLRFEYDGIWLLLLQGMVVESCSVNWSRNSCCCRSRHSILSLVVFFCVRRFLEVRDDLLIFGLGLNLNLVFMMVALWSLWISQVLLRLGWIWGDFSWWKYDQMWRLLCWRCEWKLCRWVF